MLIVWFKVWNTDGLADIVIYMCTQSLVLSGSANLLGEAHWLKPTTLARHHSNHLHELFYW